jgi:putative ABC transport system permease protein
MIKNYLRSAFRNVKRHPFISFINIFGLTVGLACCLIIVTYVINEKSYDKYNKNADDIYRVTRIFYSAPNVESLHLSSIAPAFGPRLAAAFPDMKEMTRTLPTGITSFRYGDKLFNEQNTFFADENFFDFFSVPIISGGNPHKVLAEPYNTLITNEIAKKYFGNENPVNKEIILDNNKHAFKIAGVFGAFPANSHMHPDILISFNTLKDSTIYGEKQLQTNFGNNSFYTYIMFPKNYNVERVRGQLPGFLDKYCAVLGAPAGLKPHNTTTLTLQKLTDIHLTSHLDDEVEENGNITRVYIFSAIALFILLIACINYMNLSTARSALRAREIGIRKVVGARRKEIIAQFLSESAMITYVSLVIAFGLTALLLPAIGNMSGLQLSIKSLLNWNILIPVLLLPAIVGLVSGIYPALFMSSFIPVKVLKGLFKVQTSAFSFRKILVVLQFAVSIILIVATAVVFKQLQYIQDKDLGIDKDHVLTMRFDGNLYKQYDAFKADLLSNSNVKEVGRSSRIPSGRLLDDQNASVLDNGVFQPLKVDLKQLSVDEGFIPTFGIKMAAGRNFSHDIKTDSNKYIINETAVHTLGWGTPEKAINKQIKYGNTTGNIIGVVKDFHFESLHQPIIPMILLLNPYGRLSIKVSGQNVQASVTHIRTIWQHYLPNTPFDFTFVDQRFDQLYKSEQQQGTLFTIFACIAIFIACLGLFGLSAFTINQRVKEIGVRKVLGASVPQIVQELSKEFLLLVLIATVPGLVIAEYAMNKWLLTFATRTELSWWIFASAGIIALLIAFATISYQSIKAALENPVKSLRSE